MDRAQGDVAAARGSFPLCFIIPTYNRAPALIECLRHLEGQTFSNFEVIVVDDGSTDSTPSDMERYLATTPLRVHFFCQQNSGPARARNLAVSQTASPVCIIIGDDIMASPDFAATHLRFHSENPALNIAGLGLTQWSKRGQTVTPLMRWLDESGVQFAYQDLLRGTKPGWQHFYTSNLSLKTDLLRQNPFDERFTKSAWMMEDMELGYRLEVQQGLRIIFLPEAYAEHVHPTDLRKSCRRAYNAGISLRLFDQLWPNRRKQPGRVKRIVRGILCRNSWLLPPATWLVEIVSRSWCPNPLLRPLLMYHSALGYRDSGLPDQKVRK